MRRRKSGRCPSRLSQRLELPELLHVPLQSLKHGLIAAWVLLRIAVVHAATCGLESQTVLLPFLWPKHWQCSSAAISIHLLVSPCLSVPLSLCLCVCLPGVSVSLRVQVPSCWVAPVRPLKLEARRAIMPEVVCDGQLLTEQSSSILCILMHAHVHVYTDFFFMYLYLYLHM